ncbi:MAG TPA: ribonuclease HII [Candidatus Bathyarchaeia archaeon]|nr:ribonuclease HII [Candidatus Bathyarchaeia archaeon]
MLVCGVDDAGRGPVIGPLVIAGVMVEESKIQKLKDIGVKDSKMLRPDARTRLSKEILEIVDDHHVIELAVEELDKVVHIAPKLHRLNLLEAKAMARVIERLKPRIAYVDASDTRPDRFRRNILDCLSFRPKLISEHKADINYPIVSAASILAKVNRDNRIQEIKQDYGEFGSGYVHDKRTIDFLYEYYLSHHDFPPIVRRSWITLRNIVNDLTQARLV